MRSQSQDGTQRVFELTLHRTMVKDMIIEVLELELMTTQVNKAA